MGDPQAPLEKVFAVLDAHGLRDGHGRLRDEVELVSMGDHFDWGPREKRAKATADALELLEWLASHDPGQVTLILGNHDTARVGELEAFDAASYEAARAEADLGYYDQAPSRSEREFRKAFDVPSWEILARDFSAFAIEQRALVERLLREHRFRLAHAEGEHWLLTHAGVSEGELDALSIPHAMRANARHVAKALNRALDAAVDAWTSGPFSIPGLHEPGNAAGEGTGMLYHRPAFMESRGSLGRRFHPTTLPVGLVQAIGHIRDKKCRELLNAQTEPPRDGPLRTLRVLDGRIQYDFGVGGRHGNESTMVFLDGGMSHADPNEYELLDLDTRTIAKR